MQIASIANHWMTYKMSIQGEQAWFFPPAVCENTMITENYSQIFPKYCVWFIWITDVTSLIVWGEYVT